MIVPAFTLDKVTEFIELLNIDVKGVKDSDHNNNNSVDDISLLSLGQDSQIEVDTTKYESEPVVEDVEEAKNINNNSDNCHHIIFHFQWTALDRLITSALNKIMVVWFLAIF